MRASTDHPGNPAEETDFRIDTATPEDIPQLTTFLKALFTQERDFVPDGENQARGLQFIIERPQQGRIFVIRKRGELIGMVNLLFTISTAEGGLAVILEDMFIRSEFRGLGLGSRLLRHAIEFARREGYARITLLTDAGENPAYRFYLRHGFAASHMVPMRLHLHTMPISQASVESTR